VHVAPSCTGSGEGSDHFGSYVCRFSLHFCKRLFLGLEPMTSWSQGNSFTAGVRKRVQQYYWNFMIFPGRWDSREKSRCYYYHDCSYVHAQYVHNICSLTCYISSNHTVKTSTRTEFFLQYSECSNIRDNNKLTISNYSSCELVLYIS
jgi:hypothetical protein